MISVIIPTHDPNPVFLRQTLDSIAKQTTDRYEVVVVENPELTDDVAELCGEYSKQMDIIHINSLAGANHARNRGVESASGDTVLFIDDDILLSNTLLQKYMAAQDVYNAGIIGGPVHLRYVDGKPRWINNHFEGYLARVDHGNPYGMTPFELWQRWELDVPIVSANMCLKKKVFNILGGFDVDQGYIGGSLLAPNDELNLVIAAGKGYNPGMIYMPEAHVTHLIPKERTTAEYFSRRMYGQGVADFRSFSKISPELSKLEIYEKIILEHSSLMINDASSFYCLFKGMKRLERLYATKTYHKARNDYVNGILSQIQI